MLNAANLLLRAGAPVLPLSRHVPFIVQKKVIEKAMARLFAQPLEDGEFDVLQDRWLRIEVTDLGLGWSLTRAEKGLRLQKHSPVNVCIRGNWKEFLLLASRQEDPDTLFFRRRLIIEGDTDLGLAIKNLVDSLDADLMPTRLWRLISWLGAAAKEQQHGPVASGARA
ncbi:ubiquinone anaerobic biosynthesis accessory factor UbiT [Pseudomonas sp. FME51]|uniref:ubiquinone anaerobic biosynthesis accessory factor UbiT n=1 Tax=Pseudomonas sp. FME51 TaxID=2742609 RepID=UPI0018678FF9|nr:SCP2 sterol-binding domain-containing protein [Pseudomonas sp. FME51]